MSFFFTRVQGPLVDQGILIVEDS